MKFIPYGKQDISQEDIDEVLSVLKSDFLTQGPQVPAFENLLTRYTGAQYALAVNSATSALHIACMALDLGEGDILWTTPITFVASANCGVYCGASIDFVDIDADTYNLCPIALEKKLQEAQQRNVLPKVLVAVHLCGQPCDMEKIWALSKKYGFKVIEDASHAIGGSYKNLKVGSCKYSDITVFSFHPVKIVTTAEGGAALTNNSTLAEKMSLYRSHGVTRDNKLMKGESHGTWYYQQVTLGYNYRMTELQAALGVSQMARLDDFIESRHTLARKYDRLLKDLPVKLPFQLEDSYSGLHLYVIRLKLDQLSKTRKQIFDELRDAGIGVNVHYIPVHTQPFYKEKFGFAEREFPQAEAYYEEAISIPMFHGMKEEQLKRVVDSLFKIIK
jgi:UDP-4-amino-4,6-dideoxy-N-acetyl-beta-L-altrosamine transaminase